MKKHNKTWTDKKWAAIKLVANELGVEDEAIRKWRERKRIPGDWHLPLLSKGLEMGAKITTVDLR